MCAVKLIAVERIVTLVRPKERHRRKWHERRQTQTNSASVSSSTQSSPKKAAKNPARKGPIHALDAPICITPEDSIDLRFFYTLPFGRMLHFFPSFRDFIKVSKRVPHRDHISSVSFSSSSSAFASEEKQMFFLSKKRTCHHRWMCDGFLLISFPLKGVALLPSKQTKGAHTNRKDFECLRRNELRLQCAFFDRHQSSNS